MLFGVFVRVGSWIDVLGRLVYDACTSFFVAQRQVRRMAFRIVGRASDSALIHTVAQPGDH